MNGDYGLTRVLVKLIAEYANIQNNCRLSQQYFIEHRNVLPYESLNNKFKNVPILSYDKFVNGHYNIHKYRYDHKLIDKLINAYFFEELYNTYNLATNINFFDHLQGLKVNMEIITIVNNISYAYKDAKNHKNGITAKILNIIKNLNENYENGIIINKLVKDGNCLHNKNKEVLEYFNKQKKYQILFLLYGFYKGILEYRQIKLEFEEDYFQATCIICLDYIIRLCNVGLIKIDYFNIGYNVGFILNQDSRRNNIRNWSSERLKFMMMIITEPISTYYKIYNNIIKLNDKELNQDCISFKQGFIFANDHWDKLKIHVGAIISKETLDKI
jgi:hypothetical protein